MKKFAPFVAIAAVLIALEIVQRVNPLLYRDERFAAAIVILIPIYFFLSAVRDLLRGHFSYGEDGSTVLVTKSERPIFFYVFITSMLAFSLIVIAGIARRFIPL